VGRERGTGEMRRVGKKERGDGGGVTSGRRGIEGNGGGWGKDVGGLGGGGW